MENIQTRTEHSRSVEDAERYRALNTLTELGLLIPVTELKTYHGRLGKEGEGQWAVIPTFANGANDSGNYNVNNRPTLYTADEATAEEFAHERHAEVARPIYSQKLTNKVLEYADEDRAAWLDRLNQKREELIEQKEAGTLLWGEPKATPYIDEDLADSRLVRQEVSRIRSDTTSEEHQRFWTEAQAGHYAETHEIVVDDLDARVIDMSFDDEKLSNTDKERYRNALNALLIKLTDGSPVDFADRDKTKGFIDAAGKRKVAFITNAEVTEMDDDGSYGPVATQLAGAMNAYTMARYKPAYLASKLLRHGEDLVTDTINVGGEHQEVPQNLEYVQRYFRTNHIVGVKQSINSATIGRTIDAVSFFDLEKTEGNEQMKARRQATAVKLGAAAKLFAENPIAEQESEGSHLLYLLNDAHAKPNKLVAAAKQVGDFDRTFDADTGNWEGYTLAEHTETVLRNFDETYADKIPVELLAPMRLAILSHDLGKPAAASKGEKHLQKDYNTAEAARFYRLIGLPDNASEMLVAMIGEGEEHAFDADIRKPGPESEQKLTDFARHTMQQYNGGEEPTAEQVSGFTEMCRILQVCDGGAYTSMAVTTRPGRGAFRNAPSFNSSFAPPVDFGKRQLVLRDGDQSPAPKNLTPNAPAQQSRLKIKRTGAGNKPPVIHA